MGISIKLAPGVRIRASSRGIRTSVGPRSARVHVGAGRAGLSTGAGPVGFYTSLGGSSRRPGNSARRPSTGSVSRSLAGQEKRQRANEAAARIQQILALHIQEFEPVGPPVAPEPVVVALEQLERRHRAEHCRGVGWFRFRRRAEAKQAARATAQQDHAQRQARAREEQAAAQVELDTSWARLLDNDPDVVLSVLDEAFEDNDAAAAPLGVEGSTAHVAVLVPGVETVPEKMPGVTAAGNPSLRKMTKKQSAALYSEMVAGYAMATAKEAFAVAPHLSSVSVMALRKGLPDAYGRVSGEVLMAFALDRAALTGVQWQETGAMKVVEDASSSLVVHHHGVAQELQPLTSDDVDDLDAVMAAFDLGE